MREGERRQHLSEGLGRASYLSPPSTCVQAAFSDGRGAAGVYLNRRRQTVSLTSDTNAHVLNTVSGDVSLVPGELRAKNREALTTDERCPEARGVKAPRGDQPLR